MRCPLPFLVLACTLACAGERAAGPRTSPVAVAGEASVLRAAEMARVRCLLVAPLDNASDVPHAADAATGALVTEVQASRAKVFPIADLRALFRDTPLELPLGVGPSLALELAGLVGADAALSGSVEGRSQDSDAELLVTVRLALAGDHRLVFAQSVLVTPAAGEGADSAVRRAVLAAVRPALTRLGDAGGRRCFDPDRSTALRSLAIAEAAESRADHGPTVVTGTRAEPVAPPAGARPPAAAPKTPRQPDWARRLDAGDRIVLDEVSFIGRSAELQRDAGLSDLAAAMLAEPGLSVRVEAFVDATSDRAGDHELSRSMARAAARRLVDLGVAVQRVTWSGRGAESPRLPNFTARGRAANRRIEVVAAR